MELRDLKKYHLYSTDDKDGSMFLVYDFRETAEGPGAMVIGFYKKDGEILDCWDGLFGYLTSDDADDLNEAPMSLLYKAKDEVKIKLVRELFKELS